LKLRNVLIATGLLPVLTVLAAAAEKDGGKDRKATFLEARSLLSAEEAKFDKDEPVDKDALSRAVETLQPLQWERDGVAASSFVEAARAQVMLGQHDNAIATLKMGSTLMAQLDAILAKKGKRGGSPLAGAFYYYGKALRGRALAEFRTDRKKESKTSLVEATKRFRKVLRLYPDSPYKAKAADEFEECRKILARNFRVRIKPIADKDDDLSME